MKILVDTHTHTIASGHAFCTIHEMARAAKEKGLEAIAITEHGPTMPGGAHLYYFKNYNMLSRCWDGIPVLFGVELNILDEKGTLDLPDHIIKRMDITIASMHTRCYENKGKEINTQAYMKLMDRGDVDIIGHPDDGRFPVDYEQLVAYAKKTGTLLEVNNHSLNPDSTRAGAHDNCLEMLTYCREMRVPIVLGSDAHVDTQIADTTYSFLVLQEVNFPEELVANRSYEELKKYLRVKRHM